MDKKLFLKIAGSNIGFFILTIFAFINMSLDFKAAITTINLLSARAIFDYNLFQTTIDVQTYGYRHIYKIGHYFVIPALVGILHNTYYMIKVKRRTSS